MAPLWKCLRDGGIKYVGAVDEVTDDDDGFRLPFLNEVFQPQEAFLVGAFGDGDTGVAKGGGFSEVEVSDDEAFALRQVGGSLR